MAITIETPTAEAVVDILKQQLSPVEWDKLPRLIEQANEKTQVDEVDEESEFYAASHQAANRFFADEEE